MYELLFGVMMNELNRRSVDEIQSIVGLLEIKKGESIIDAGGRDGSFAKQMLPFTDDITVLDANDTYFDELKKVGIKTIKADFCEYSDGNYDLVFMSNVYHDFVSECGEKVLKNIEKIARKKIAVFDFKPKHLGFGPPINIRLDRTKVINDMKSINFNLVNEKDFNSHYFLLFERNG